MIDLIYNLYASLMGGEIIAVVVAMLAFSLVSSLVGKFLDCLHIKGNTWTYAVKICIAYMAISALGGLQWSLSFS